MEVISAGRGHQGVFGDEDFGVEHLGLHGESRGVLGRNEDSVDGESPGSDRVDEARHDPGGLDDESSVVRPKIAIARSSERVETARPGVR